MSSAWELEAAGRAEVQGQAQQHSKSEARLGYTILGLIKKKKIKKQHSIILALEKLQRIPSMSSPKTEPSPPWFI